MLQRTLLASFCATGLLLSSACSPKMGESKSKSVSSAAVSNRKPAPDFTLKDAEGKSLKLSNLRGKVVLLNFWATWCGPCALEIPWFVEFQQKYKNQGLEIVGVSMDEDGWTAVKPYIAEHKINYHVLLGDDSVSQLYGGVDSLPTTFLIDRNGKFALSPHVGLAGKNEYLSDIQTLLNENKDSSVFATGLFRLWAGKARTR